VYNPNNTTGVRLTLTDVDGLVELTSNLDYWLIADEPYRGANIDGQETDGQGSTQAGHCHQRSVENLRPPGTAPQRDRESIRVDQSALGTERLLNHCAWFNQRSTGGARSRGLFRGHQAITRDWVAERDDVQRLLPEADGGTLLVYEGHTPSACLTETLRVAHRALVVPGAHFRMEHHLRVDIGDKPEQLREGPARLGQIIDK
jgi:aspartate/methionine/tyrosine aminotransferase